MNKPIISLYALYHSPNLGGCEETTKNYFKNLTNIYDIYATCFLQYGNMFFNREEFVEDGINVIRSNLPIAEEVRGSIYKNRPDLIVTQLLGKDVVINEATKNNIPVVCFIHGIAEDFCSHYLKNTCKHFDVVSCPKRTSRCIFARELEKMEEMYSKCCSIICNSGYTKKIFCSFFPKLKDKVKVVYPNFNWELFTFKEKVKKRKLKVLAINSMPFKGSDIVFNIADQNPDWDFTYIDSRIDPNLTRALPKNIEFLGKVGREELVSFYHESDVFLLPTFFSETFSAVCAESILTGTPVIATNSGNLPYLIVDGYNGFLMNNYKAEDWSTAIKEISEVKINRKYSDNLRTNLNMERGLNTINDEFSKSINYYNINDLTDDGIGKESFEIFAPGEKPKVLAFNKFYSPPLGGGEYFLQQILQYLKKKRFDVLSACYCDPDPTKKMKTEIYNWDGIDVYRFGVMSSSIMENFFKQHKPDLIITQSFDAPVIVSIAKKLGIKTILGTHFWRNICEVQDNFVNMLSRPLDTVHIRKDLHRVFREADETYVNSDYMQKAVERYVGIKIPRIIYPMFDKDRVVSKERNPKYITLINCDTGKGGRLFVELAKSMPEFDFMCLGLGNEILPENKAINDEIKNIKNIKVVENTDNVAEVYKETKIILVPSNVDETFSMCALEAMSNGIPVIASCYGNLPFLVRNGGFILDPIDVFEWEEKVRELFDESVYQIYSENALKRSKDFDSETQLRKFYEMVLKCVRR